MGGTNQGLQVGILPGSLFSLPLCFAVPPMSCQTSLCFVGPCGLMDKALVFGNKDCRVESCQGHFYPLLPFICSYLKKSWPPMVFKTVCPGGLRGWSQVPLAQAAWVQIPQLSISFHPSAVQPCLLSGQGSRPMANAIFRAQPLGRRESWHHCDVLFLSDTTRHFGRAAKASAC